MQYEFAFKVKKGNWAEVVCDFLSHFEETDFYKPGMTFKWLLVE